MSWSEALSAGGRCLRASVAAKAAAAAICGALLAGCGGSPLQPLYGTAASGRQMTDVLANLDVSIVPGRVGQRVRNELLFYKSGSGDAAPVVGAEFRLEIALRESTQSVHVSTTGLAGGQVFALDSTFKVVRVKDGKIVYQGNSYARAPYETNKVTDPLESSGASTGRSVFGNVRAAYDAQNRAANHLASDIRTRVAAFLSGAA
jgi:LPS-assembly lipoprotein